MVQRPADLLKLPLLHSMMRMEAWDLWLARHDLTTSRTTTSINFANAALAYEAAAEGLGVAMAQHAYVANDLASGKLSTPFPTPVSTATSYYLVAPNTRAQLSKNQHFAAWVRDITSASDTARNS